MPLIQNNNQRNQESENVEIDLNCPEKVTDSDVESNHEDKVRILSIEKHFSVFIMNFKFLAPG